MNDFEPIGKYILIHGDLYVARESKEKKQDCCRFLNLRTAMKQNAHYMLR